VLDLGPRFAALVIPAKAGIQGGRSASVGLRSSQRQALTPSFRGGEESRERLE
jgi:hypothetical protein